MSQWPLSYENLPAELRARVPGFERVYDEHVGDYDTVLPHVLLGDLVRFLAGEVRTSGAGAVAVTRVVQLMEAAMASGDPRLQELVSVSFLENMLAEGQTFATIRRRFGPHLSEELRRRHERGRWWRFPSGVAGGFDVRDAGTASVLLRRVEAWRSAVAGVLAEGSAWTMSDTLRDLLQQVLGVRPSRTLASCPYHLEPYPGSGGEPVATLRRVLLWRAGVVDFLADAWDTLGPPPFTMDECGEAAEIFEPEDLTPQECPLCLGRLPADPTTHCPRCPVQLAWDTARAAGQEVDGPRSD
jgi:hypothetical protein